MDEFLSFYDGVNVPYEPEEGLDLLGRMTVDHQSKYQNALNTVQEASFHAFIDEGFSLAIGTMNNLNGATSFTDNSNRDKGKSIRVKDDELIYIEDDNDSQNENRRAEKESTWQRVKWTDHMVEVLITIVSYTGDDICSDPVMKKKFTFLLKKCKWKLVSKVMAESGFFVSAQQCEDKFNNLNKKCKKLNEILGSFSRDVVQNPALLDEIGDLHEKVKEEVQKILTSKHLFYDEMCSYNNGDRLHLPHNRALQRSLQLALASEEGLDDNSIEDEQEMETDSRGMYEPSAKRSRHGESHKDVFVGSDQNPEVGTSRMSPADALLKKWIASRRLQLEEKKLQVQYEMLELEKHKFRWQRLNWKEEIDIQKMRMENEKMKLENEQMALELNRKMLAMGLP